jgi:hypothetical protein
MLLTDWMAIASVLLLAAAILPGTLVFLMLTNKLAVSEGGARYIYGNAFWVGIASLALALYTLILAIGEGPSHYFSVPFVASVVLYGAVLVWGFFMHTKLMFQPVREPRYLDTTQALKRFGGDEEVVGVIDGAGRPWAYIARLSRRPHVVYQPEGKNPFIMTHCILAHSSMAFAMNDRFKQPDITITAALANNMVFYDKNTQCSVIQMHNRSLDKSMPLDTLPTVSMSLATWAKLYPDSKVWYRDISWRDVFYLKMLARADVIDPKSPVIVYPLQNGLDERLSMKSNVMGVKIDDSSKTYPASLFAGRDARVINDAVGDVPIALVSESGGDFVQVYDRRVDGRTLTLEVAGEGNLRDAETGSTWSIAGTATAGELAGHQLEAVPHYNKIFWYVWSDFNPGSPIYSGE